VSLTPTLTAAENTQKQWAAFVNRSKLDRAPRECDDIRELLRGFLLPVAEALANTERFSVRWTAPGPWRETLLS
jgi:hypothetical protein